MPRPSLTARQSTNLDDEAVAYMLGACSLRKLSIRNCPDVTGATIACGSLRMLDVSVCAITDDNLGATAMHARGGAGADARTLTCAAWRFVVHVLPPAQPPSVGRAPSCGT